MKAIIKLDVPDWQIGQEVDIYFPDTMHIKGITEADYQPAQYPVPDIPYLIPDGCGGWIEIKARKGCYTDNKTDYKGERR